jgi:hypothetical protein
LPTTLSGGRICARVIFNRSHYEDVLVVRVHKLVLHSVWSKRYNLINDFETMLLRNNTTILKFYLHISPEEQLARFKRRLDDPSRNWKISESDYAERELWPKYVEAYEDAIASTSTKSRALVHYSIEPQMVPQSCRIAHYCRHHGRVGLKLPPRTWTSPQSAANSTPRNARRKARQMVQKSTRKATQRPASCTIWRLPLRASAAQPHRGVDQTSRDGSHISRQRVHNAGVSAH